MKDKQARAALEMIFERVGYNLHYSDQDGRPYTIGQSYFERYKGQVNDRFSVIEERFKLMDENAKPVCKTCGQKVQEGFQVGDVEALAAELGRPAGVRKKK